MRKLLIMILCMAFLMPACSHSSEPEYAAPILNEELEPTPSITDDEETEPDYSTYTIQIYSDSVSAESMNWLLLEAKEAGFTIRINDDNTVFDDLSLLRNANESVDGDLIFGLNGIRWTELLNGDYENLSVIEWTPSWAEEVGDYRLSQKVFGTILKRSLMLYRYDEYGTKGEYLHFEHWADILDSGYQWNHLDPSDKNAMFSLNAAILFPYVDPNSPAGGISVDGWKTLWKYYNVGISNDDNDNIDPTNLDGVQIAVLSSSMLIDHYSTFMQKSGYSLSSIVIPDNWSIVEIDDGSFDTPEFIGILDKADRTDDETAAVLSFAEWFGSAEVQADWAEFFGGFPCNTVASNLLFSDEIPAPYSFHNLALEKMINNQTYSAYAIGYSSAWDNILDNLGYFQTENGKIAAAEPDWENIDWSVQSQSIQTP